MKASRAWVAVTERDDPKLSVVVFSLGCMSQWFSQLTVDQFTRSVRKPSFLLLLWSLDLVAMMVIVAYFTFPGFPSLV